MRCGSRRRSRSARPAAGAADRNRHARLRPRGAEFALGGLAAAIQRRLWNPLARRSSRASSPSSRSGGAAPRLPLARPHRLQVGRAGRGVTPTDQTLGVGNGVTATFQLVQALRGAARAYVAHHPEAGGRHGAGRGRRRSRRRGRRLELRPHHRPGDLYAGGAIPASGKAVTAGFEFDVPVRFDTDRLDINLTGFAAGDIPAIPLVEIRL